MARILVQTNDRRTVLDESDVSRTDVTHSDSAVRLLDRLERAIEAAERTSGRGRRFQRRGGTIAAARDYRDIVRS